MTLAKPINKYIDYIDAPEDTFEQYVEKALKLWGRLPVRAARKRQGLQSDGALRRAWCRRAAADAR